MDNSGRVELLAPAGSPDGFYGAACAGADAIYLGGSRFGARAFADNFTQEELVACIRYGRLFGIKVNLTVNTLLKEQELLELPDYLEPFYRAGLDAVIVQDLGVLRVIKENFPDLKIHASTQMTLCSQYGAELLKQMGVCRIVPARELNLEELIRIKKQTGIELETFVHGAMCYCYSGQCLFSSILGGRSGNRGRCAQPCRLPYTVHTAEKSKKTGENVGYPLSLKDMCTIDHLPALIEAGIDSFKIEGRMKKAEYAAGVTAVYRKYIDLYYSLREKLGAKEAAAEYRVSEEDRHILSSLYIRSEVHDGYYRKKNGREMVTLDSPAYSGTDEALLSDIRAKYLEERLRMPVQVNANFMTGQPAMVSLISGDAVGRAVGEPVQTAQKQPITEENLRRQLGKLGDSPFYAAGMEIQVDKDAFYPLKQINELRRKAVEELERALLSHNDTNQPARSETEYRPNQSIEITRKTEWVISVRTLDQLQALSEFCKTDRYKAESDYRRLHRIYVDQDLLLTHTEKVLQLSKTIISDRSCELLAALPYIVRASDLPTLERLYDLVQECGIDGYLIRSLDALGFLKSRHKNGLWRTDAGVYVWNSSAAHQLGELSDGFCIPYELNAREQRALADQLESDGDCTAFEKVVYGRLPMMVTANCVLKTTDQCRKQSNNSGGVWLTDRYKKNFPVLAVCSH